MQHQPFAKIPEFADAGMLSHKHEPGRPTLGCCEVSFGCCTQQTGRVVMLAHSQLGGVTYRKIYTSWVNLRELTL